MKQLLVLLSASLVLYSLAFAQWETDVRLTNDPANSFTAAPNNHPLCANGDSIYALFSDNRAGAYHVYFARSLDAGTTWDSAVSLSTDTTDVMTPALAASGPIIHVAWPNDPSTAILYRRSTDAGSTWSPEESLVTSPSGCGDVSLAAAGSAVGMAWGDGRDGNYNGELYFKRSTDGGLNWGADARLTESDDTLDKEACLAVAGGTWHLTWTRGDWASFHYRTWYQRSTDNGASWLTPVAVASDTTSQSQPVVAAVGPNVHVAWYDGRPGGYGMWYHRSTDFGATWNTEQYLGDTTYGSDYPSIAAAGGNVHLAFRGWPGGQLAFMYRGSTDNGQTWSAETSLTPAAGMGTAAIAAAGSRADLLLYDNREGNFEIYYKRNLAAGGIAQTTNDRGGTPNAGPTIVRGVLRLAISEGRVANGELLDISGRRVMSLHPGPNDVSRIAPGVYFARAVSRGLSAESCYRVVIQ